MNQGYAEAFGPEAETIKRYVDMLLDRGIAWGLIGPREGVRIWERHVLNSVAVASLIPNEATVVDVGSGAGLPGIPLALYRPDLRLTLLEPLARRVNFLELAVEELGLTDRVRVIRGRAEEHGERYRVVASRAVAPLPRLLGWCEALLSTDARILALKGESAAAELAEAGSVLAGLGLKGAIHEVVVPAAGGTTWVIEARRK